MGTFGTKLFWSLTGAIFMLSPFAGCELKQADVDAARQNVIEEKKDIGEAVRDGVREVGETSREARENVVEEVREANEAKQEAKRLENELAAKNDRDSFLKAARLRKTEVDSLIEKKRLAMNGLTGANLELADSEVIVLVEKRDLLEKAIDTAEREPLPNWSKQKLLVEQALKSLNDGGQ